MAIATAQQVRPVDEVVEELVEFRARHHVTRSRFIQTFVEKGLRRDRLVPFLKEYYWGMAFDGFFAFAAIAANASPFFQRSHYFSIMRNLGSEAGAGHPDGRDHNEMQLLLPRHLGVTDEEMLRHVATAPTLGFRHTVVSCCFRSFETGVACIPFTVEGQGGEMHRLMWEGFQRHFDFAPEVMTYWMVHDEVEGGHGEIGLDMLREVLETREQQWRVRDAVISTCLTYRAMWDQFEALLD
jgi:pyrroloquinoline quinone (PQQ) biosynthesis protein C